MPIKIIKKSANAAGDQSDISEDTSKLGEVIHFPAAKGMPAGEPAWLSQCQTDGKKPLNNLANIMMALRNDLALSEAIAFDEMLQAPMQMKPFPGEPQTQNFTPVYLSDHQVTRIQEYLQRCGLKGIGKDVVHQAVDARAMERSFHPVRDYLVQLQWDGTPRVSSWLSTYLGAEPSVYAQGVGKMFLVSMVARIFKPGSQADYMLVLEGAQGAGKSTACRILGGEWFSDCLPNVTGSKDVSQHLAGKWLIEISEMAALKKGETAQLKAFVTRLVERYRPTYGRKEVSQPRMCVFIGTTNKSLYLRDETGGRRFWPVEIGAIDTDKLRSDRDQLYAEAVKFYKEGVPWYPDREFERQHIQPEQDARMEVDPWEEPIRAYLKLHKLSIVYPQQLLEEPLHIEVARRRRAESLHVVAVLQRLGWRRLKKDSKGNYPWGPPLQPEAD